MLHRELKITAPQSEDEDARPAVAHKENPASPQSERWRGTYRKIPGRERSVFNVIQRGLRRIACDFTGEEPHDGDGASAVTSARFGNVLVWKRNFLHFPIFPQPRASTPPNGWIRSSKTHSVFEFWS